MFTIGFNGRTPSGFNVSEANCRYIHLFFQNSQANRSSTISFQGGRSQRIEKDKHLNWMTQLAQTTQITT